MLRDRAGFGSLGITTTANPAPNGQVVSCALRSIGIKRRMIGIIAKFDRIDNACVITIALGAARRPLSEMWDYSLRADRTPAEARSPRGARTYRLKPGLQRITFQADRTGGSLNSNKNTTEPELEPRL